VSVYCGLCWKCRCQMHFPITYRFSTTSNGSELSVRWSSSGN
jgi:hypothetical protein